MSGNRERIRIDEKVFFLLWGNRYHKAGCPYLLRAERRYEMRERDGYIWRDVSPCKHCNPNPEWKERVEEYWRRRGGRRL